jgi:asparagine synthase (glutamine-hydrolysing)
VRNLALISGEEQQYSIPSIRHFLKYLYFDPINSIYSGIKSVPPGSNLVIKDKVIDPKRIHEVYSETTPTSGSDLRAAVTTAVRRTLVADVPVGVMLSGGIDSTVIASIASLEQPGISTFTLRRSKDDDDIRFARMAAQKYGTSHHEIEIDKTTLHNDIYYVLARASQPFADTSLIPTYLLSKYASEYVKVLLSGDGADELFGGYAQYELYRTANIGNQNRLDFMLKYAKFMASKRTRSKNVWKFYFDSNFAALESGQRTFREQWNKDSEILKDKQINRIFKKNGHASKYFEPNQSPVDSLREILDLDLKSYLPADILFKSDTAGMLASVEIRAPFLDLDVSRVRDAINPSLLGNKKRVLTDAFRSDLPLEIVSRKKAGFGAPVDDWFQIPSVNNMAEELIQDKSNGIYDIMNFKEVQKMIRVGGNLVRWEILSLAIWVKENA